jgi:integrase
MGRYVKKRKKSYYLNLPIPVAIRYRYGGKAKLEDTLRTSDEKVAEAKALEIAGRLKLEALQEQGNPQAQDALLRLAYQDARREVLSGERRLTGYTLTLDDGREVEIDPVEEAIEAELDQIREDQWNRADPDDPHARPVSTPIEDARAAGLMDGLRELQGERPMERHRFEPPFTETAREWLEEWQRSPGRKAANTAGQYQATIDAFGDWWDNKPIRAIGRGDAANYVSHLTRVSPGQARHRRRSTATNKPSSVGLAVATIRRHVNTLSQIWEWAKPRLNLAGDNPWRGVAPRKPKRPPNEHMPWTHPELRRLLIDNRPKRRDVYEACLVALHTGMRASEIANLTWENVDKVEGVWCFHIADSKTVAGIRRVPVHQSLAWLLKRKPDDGDGKPIWPTFNPEGPGNSRGDDLSRLFGRYKTGLGFGRQRTFHSFRKNVTQKSEELELSQNVWARLVGHDPGMTYGVYNPTGLSPAKSQEIINRIRYADLDFPDPEEAYGLASTPSNAGHPKGRRKG